jgi:hypothetical protein
MVDERKESGGGGAATAPERNTPDRTEDETGTGATSSVGPGSAHGGGEGVADKAREMKEGAKAAATEAKERAGAGARQVKEDARRKGEELRREAEETADRWTERMGSRVDHVAHALRAASESLESEGEGELAGMVEDAAEQVDRMGGYLEGEEPSSMMSDLRSLGRRNPGAFLGGALLAGLAAGRFLRSSEPSGDDGEGFTAPTGRPRDPVASAGPTRRRAGSRGTERGSALQTTPAGALEDPETRAGRTGAPAPRSSEPTRDDREGGAS